MKSKLPVLQQRVILKITIAPSVDKGWIVIWIHIDRGNRYGEISMINKPYSIRKQSQRSLVQPLLSVCQQWNYYDLSSPMAWREVTFDSAYVCYMACLSLLFSNLLRHRIGCLMLISVKAVDLFWNENAYLLHLPRVEGGDPPPATILTLTPATLTLESSLKLKILALTMTSSLDYLLSVIWNFYIFLPWWSLTLECVLDMMVLNIGAEFWVLVFKEL